MTSSIIPKKKINQPPAASVCRKLHVRAPKPDTATIPLTEAKLGTRDTVARNAPGTTGLFYKSLNHLKRASRSYLGDLVIYFPCSTLLPTHCPPTMWRRTYLFLVLLRLWFALSPSYLHPDENFQGPEVVAGMCALSYDFISRS